MQTFLNTLANYWTCWAVEDQTRDSKVSEGDHDKGEAQHLNPMGIEDEKNE